MSDFTPELKAQLDHWIAKYPPNQKKSAVLPVLLLIQETYENYLTPALMQQAADYLDMPYIAVYEVAKFYTMYDLEPVGKYKIGICTNISCMLAGSGACVAHLKKTLNIDINQTTQNKKFTLKEVECLGACVNAPVMHIAHAYYENLTLDKIDQILEGLK